MRLGMIQGKFDDSKLQEAIKEVAGQAGQKRHRLVSLLTAWKAINGSRTCTLADGKLAYSVPTLPPAEYLAHHTEGVDYMRAVDAQTGKVTITPFPRTRLRLLFFPSSQVPRSGYGSTFWE